MSLHIMSCDVILSVSLPIASFWFAGESAFGRRGRVVSGRPGVGVPAQVPAGRALGHGLLRPGRHHQQPQGLRRPLLQALPAQVLALERRLPPLLPPRLRPPRLGLPQARAQAPRRRHLGRQARLPRPREEVQLSEARRPGPRMLRRRLQLGLVQLRVGGLRVPGPGRQRAPGDPEPGQRDQGPPAPSAPRTAPPEPQL